MDFFFAQWLIVLTALTFIDFPDEWEFVERIIIIGSGFVIFLTEIALEESNYIQIVLAVVSLLMIVIYWIIYAVQNDGQFPPYDWSMLVMGLGCTALACNLYVTQLQYHALYWATHSNWHVLAPFGQYFFLLMLPRKPDAEYKALDEELVSRSLTGAKGKQRPSLIKHFLK